MNQVEDDSYPPMDDGLYLKLHAIYLICDTMCIVSTQPVPEDDIYHILMIYRPAVLFAAG